MRKGSSEFIQRRNAVKPATSATSRVMSFTRRLNSGMTRTRALSQRAQPAAAGNQ